MTVTAPLDMGTGQQRFVVAYTLKGVEKQPDILSAQKSESSLGKRELFPNSNVRLKTDCETDSQGLGSSPAVHRPDALYLSKSNYTASNYVNFYHTFTSSRNFSLFSFPFPTISQGSPVYASQDYNDHKLTPSSHASSLRRNDAKNAPMNKSLTLSSTSQASNIYDSIGPKLVANTTTDHHQLIPNIQTSNAQNTNTLPSLPTHRPEYLNFDRNTLDYRLKNAAATDLQANVELRSKNNGSVCNPSDEYNRLSGSDYVTNNIDFSLSNSNQMMQMQRVNNSSSTMNNKNRQSRNHIITDTLPGPESCV